MNRAEKILRMLLEDTLVYQVDAYGLTVEKIAKMFASEYFDKPREIEWMKDNRFKLVDGVAMYEIRFVPGKRFETVDLFQVFRLEGYK